MLQLIQLILQNLTFFALHLKNLTSFPKPLSAREEREAVAAMAAGDASARQRLVEHNLRLVAHIIKKRYANAAEQEENASTVSMSDDALTASCNVSSIYISSSTAIAFMLSLP